MLLSYLLKKGANPNIEDHRALTSLHTATYHDIEQAAEHLLIASANIDVQYQIGDTALHITLARLEDLLASMLVEYEVIMTLENDFGQI